MVLYLHLHIICILITVTNWLSIYFIFEEENYAMERNLLQSELKRVHDFAILSENADFAYTELEDVTSYYNLSIF